MIVSMPLMALAASTTAPVGRSVHALGHGVADPRRCAPCCPGSTGSRPRVLSWTLLALTLGVMAWAGRHFYVARLVRLPPPLGGHEHAGRRRHGRGVPLLRCSPRSRPASSSRRGVAPDVYYEAVVIIIALILTGNAFEARAKSRTSAALRALVALQPKTARVLREGDAGDRRAGRAGAARRHGDRPPGRAGAGGRRGPLRRERGRRVDAHRRVDAGREAGRATA